MTTTATSKYIQVNPTSESADYWVAVKGKAFALWPKDVNNSCIARVEDDMCIEHGAKGCGYNDVYVISRPKNNSQNAWKNWSKKWSQRTSVN